MSPFHISYLLSESISGECGQAVIARKHSHSYADEQNGLEVPPEMLEAGEEV